MIKKSAILTLILALIISLLVTGCSQEEPVGYTFDMTKKCQGIRLAGITNFKHEIDSKTITGSMKIGHKKVTFKGNKKESNTENNIFEGKIYFNDETCNFVINYSGLADATGLYYNDTRTMVNGFVIERFVEDEQ